MSRATRLRFTLPAVALLLALAACSSDADSATPADAKPTISTAYELPEERAYPEGIAVDARSGDIYVGSFSTGAIYKATSGNPKAEVFLPTGTDGRTTANGLRVDAAGRLWVTDHTTGVAVYDTKTRALLARFDAPAADKPFLNDLTITPDGTVYLTDSVRPVIYRVTAKDLVDATAQGGAELRTFTDLSNAKAPEAALLLNGIVSDPAGRYLLTVCMATGDLYRISLDEQPQITKVELRGGNMIYGDGLELRDNTLWVVHNKENAVSRWQLTNNGATAELQQLFTDAALSIPTTIAHAGNRALVVVSQFDRGGPMGEGTPTNPFRVVAIDGI